jgi:hypothetical protein
MLTALEETQKKLTALLTLDNVDLQAVRSELTQASETWGELRYSCIRNVIEVRNVLGEEKWNVWQKTSSFHPLEGFAHVCLDYAADAPCRFKGDDNVTRSKAPKFDTEKLPTATGSSEAK